MEQSPSKLWLFFLFFYRGPAIRIRYDDLLSSRKHHIQDLFPWNLCINWSSPSIVGIRHDKLCKMLSHCNLKRKWQSEMLRLYLRWCQEVCPERMSGSSWKREAAVAKHNRFMRQMVCSVLFSNGKHIIIHIHKLCIKHSANLWSQSSLPKGD